MIDNIARIERQITLLGQAAIYPCLGSGAVANDSFDRLVRAQSRHVLVHVKLHQMRNESNEGLRISYHRESGMHAKNEYDAKLSELRPRPTARFRSLKTAMIG